MRVQSTIPALAAALLIAACGPGDERIDETYRQQAATPAAELEPGDTTISGQVPVVDRPHLPRERDTMGAGAGTSVVPPAGTDP